MLTTTTEILLNKPKPTIESSIRLVTVNISVQGYILSWLCEVVVTGHPLLTLW